jgi:D-amino peptidase
MRVAIIALLAGTAGVVHRNQVDPDSEAPFLHTEARELMAREIEAAVNGALQAGAEEVNVHDATGLVTFRDDLLHPGANYVFGHNQQVRFNALADADAAILLGHPAQAGTWSAVLCQTLAPSVQRIRLNGQDVGTIGVHAALCGAQGVPVVVASGDNYACAEAEALLPGVQTCTTKWGFGYQAAKLRTPVTVREDLSATINAALTADPLPPVWALQPPYEIHVTVSDTHVWDGSTFTSPRQERLDGRNAVFRGNDLPFLIEHIWEIVQ